MEPRLWVDELLIYDANDDYFTGPSNSIEKDSAGKVKAVGVTKAQDVKDVFDRFVNLKQITFFTHGTPGKIYFSHTAIGPGDILSTFNVRSNLFAAGEGRLLFTGCQVGEGQWGETFLVCAGQKLLKGHGGFVGATDVKNGIGLNFRLFKIPFEARVPGYGNLRMIRLDAQGNVLKDESQGWLRRQTL